MENKISICIPCIEKHTPFLYNCIDSINNQSVTPYEIIISISNISDLKRMDDIKKLCEKIKIDSKIPIYIEYTFEKKYAGENRNICINKASGDIISFIDADDIMHKDRIKIIKNIFDKYPNHVGILHYFVENQYLDTNEEFEQNHLIQYSFSHLLHFGHASFRKKIFDEYKYGSDPRGQDVKFIASILPKYFDNLLIYKKPLTFYMSNNSSYYNKTL